MHRSTKNLMKKATQVQSASCRQLHLVLFTGQTKQRGEDFRAEREALFNAMLAQHDAASNRLLKLALVAARGKRKPSKKKKKKKKKSKNKKQRIMPYPINIVAPIPDERSGNSSSNSSSDGSSDGSTDGHSDSDSSSSN